MKAIQLSLGRRTSNRDSVKTLKGTMEGVSLTLCVDTNEPSQRYIYDHWVNGAIYEGETIIEMIPYFKDAVFFDVGAHIGYFSVIATAFGAAKVVAFEPNEQNRAMLARNVPTATIINGIASDKCGMVKFYENADNDGGHALWNPSAHPHNSETRAGNSEPSLVDSFTLDSFADMKPTIIKVDTEGAEFLVMRGAGEILTQPQLKMIVCESHELGARLLGGSVDILLSEMRDAGWVSRNDSSTLNTIGNIIFTRKQTTE